MTDAVSSPVMPRMRLRDHASFQRFLASRVLSSMAFQGTGIAIGWLVYDRTNNAFDLGLIGLVQFLPMLVLTFVVGHVADQFDRRRIGLICQIIEAGVVGIIALGVWQGWLSTPGIFLAVAVLGAAQAFERPTMAALLPGLMPASMLQPAIAISTSFMQAAFIAGPTMGGLLYGVGPVAPFAAAAVMFLIASFCVSSIAKAERVPVRSKPTLSSVFAGIAFIRSKPVLLGTISLDLFAVLLGGATALLPMFARDILHAGPWALGLLRAAPAVGAVTMSLVLARFPLRHHVGKIMLSAVAVFGVATLVFSLSTDIALSIAALVTLGAADTVSVVIRSSLVQLLTPDEMRGRVNAVNSLFIGTSNQLGEFESGMAAALLGPVGAGVFGAVGTLVIVALWAGLFPSLRKVDTLEG